jgi:hypothetical protein
MKKMAVLLIVFGSGLAAFGISGFGGSFSPPGITYTARNEWRSVWFGRVVSG